MKTDLDEIAFAIENSETKLMFLVGLFDEFTAHNLCNDFNYSLLDFDDFLKVNNIDSTHFKGTDATRTLNININIESWTQKVAFKEQKSTIIIDGYSPDKIPDYLTKSLLMQELLYLSKNSSKLKANLVFIIDLSNGLLENQILPKVLPNCNVIRVAK